MYRAPSDPLSVPIHICRYQYSQKAIVNLAWPLIKKKLYFKNALKGNLFPRDFWGFGITHQQVATTSVTFSNQMFQN